VHSTSFYLWERCRTNAWKTCWINWTYENSRCEILFKNWCSDNSIEDEKIYLTNNIQSTVLDIKRNINISFNKELEFDFYIVLDQIASKLSTSEQVVFRLKQSLKSRPSHHSNFYFSFWSSNLAEIFRGGLSCARYPTVKILVQNIEFNKI
jgi:hypothetical protein